MSDQDKSPSGQAEEGDHAMETEPVLTPETQSAGQAEAGDADLESQLAQAREQADKHWEDLLRLRAEMDNLRKRSAREIEKARKFALERIAGDLLQVYDSLERGLDADVEGASVEKLREGTDLTLKLLHKVLEDHGVEQLNPHGEQFDPERHEAISAQPSPEVAQNHVMMVVQKGYRLNERLIRPAMVVVSKGASGDA